MDQVHLYNGSLTAEQFLFYEIRIAAKYYIDGKTMEEAIEIIKNDNLFQYPTERQISRIARACYKRLDALDNGQLVHELAFASSEIAKQINLYAIMKYNRLVWEFITRLQAQNDFVSAWSDNTVKKIKSVLVRMLVETEYLDGIRSTSLNPILLCEELEEGIRANHDDDALPAFNCFR